MSAAPSSLLTRWGRQIFANTFITLYEHFVRERAPFRYTVPRNERTAAAVERVRKALLVCRAPLDDYVAAQFDAFDEAFCALTFRRAWPPLNVFAGAKAVARWERWQAWRDRAATHDDRARRTHTARLERSAAVWRQITAEAPARLAPDLLRMAIANGSITPDYVVWRVRQGELRRPDALSLLELLPDRDAETYAAQVKAAALEAAVKGGRG